MARPLLRREGRGALLGLVLGALGLIAGSGFLFSDLRLSHQTIDLAYSEGPQAFRAWLSRTWRTRADDEEIASAVSKRLMSMPIATRRRTIAAITDEAFWSGVAADAVSRRALQMKVREAVLLSLRQAPAAGDLWLAAASLHTVLDGFDARAAGYLTASYRLAPREGQVAYARAGLIVQILPVLEGGLAKAATDDLALIEATYPRLHRALAPTVAATEQSNAGR